MWNKQLNPNTELVLSNNSQFENNTNYVSRIIIPDANMAEKMIAKTVKRHGHLDILVNNASILGPMSLLSELSQEDWDEVVRINLNGLFYVTRAVLPVMLRENSGRIINITSSVGRKGRACWGAYSVSKFGVEGKDMAWRMSSKRQNPLWLEPGRHHPACGLRPIP
jgi:NAD(P)-dependent dehydrogenase (short-subunit alcohol dehydrogenase family)